MFSKDIHESLLEGGDPQAEFETPGNPDLVDNEGRDEGSSSCKSREAELDGLPQLDNEYGDLFRDLCKATVVETQLNIINCIITYDSKHVISLSVDDRTINCKITEHDLVTFERIFELDVKGSWVVMNEIEQNNEGNVFCVPYSDNGKITALVFSNKGQVIDTLDLNEQFSMDTDSKPIFGFFNPMVTCCFVKDDNIFISAYHRDTFTQYNSIYSYKEH